MLLIYDSWLESQIEIAQKHEIWSTQRTLAFSEHYGKTFGAGIAFTITIADAGSEMLVCQRRVVEDDYG